MKATIHVGDCRKVLKTFTDNSVDAVVCDPPYEINFMSKSFDRTGVAHDVATWKECLRVLKPGGFCLAFGGDRTHHRLVCAIEDAGFEIRGNCAWLFSQGFPKSHSISVALDKAAGAERSVIGTSERGSGAHRIKLDNHGQGDTGIGYMDGSGKVFDVTAPATDAAKQWAGWGTALKPAMELICVARKPIEGTVAANVLKWGTGALNIDGCRVEPGAPISGGGNNFNAWRSGEERNDKPSQHGISTNGHTLGRWPANVIHDGSEEVISLFPQSDGQQGDVRGDEPSRLTNGIFGEYEGRVPAPARNDEGSASRFFYQVRGDEPSAERTYEDSGSTNFAMTPGARRLDDGSASRFFYTAKASGDERGEGNNHPTVKPVDLMAYLCRLVTPPHGIVLDPFTGSGSTGIAALREGFEFIGIEVDPKYAAIAEKRIKGDNPLFSEVELKA